MTLVRTSGPDAEPVAVAELRQHLRLGHDSEDELLAGLIRAAREDVERATGLALIEQGWRLVLDAWPQRGRIFLMRHPVREVVSVTVYDTEGQAAVLSPGFYETDMLSRPARLMLRRALPDIRAVNGIDVEFVAGFGEAGPDVPDLLRRAILVLAAHWYEFRASYGPDDQPVSYPAVYERLIAGYRDRRL